MITRLEWIRGRHEGSLACVRWDGNFCRHLPLTRTALVDRAGDGSVLVVVGSGPVDVGNAQETA
jgi:hypothetical protein